MSIQTKLNYLTNRELFSNYYLEELLPETDRWQDVDEEKIRSVYENIKEIYEGAEEYGHTFTEDYLEDKIIRPVFKELGFFYGTREKVQGPQRFPDYGLFDSEEALHQAYKNKEEEDFYKNAISIGEAKKWGRNLDKRGGVRDFTNPSHQVYVYQQETNVDWAILTNGKEWRLYYSKTSHKLDSYYEIDIPTLLNSVEKESFEIFKYFYLFFRKKAFVKDKSGNSFLDRIYDKSHIFSRELGENLKENIYEAIKLLAEGFLKYPQNDLNPEEDKKIIHDSSLVYLYRMIFVLYAESEGRDLLDTNNKIYNDKYSLNQLKQEVCEELEKSEPAYKNWQDDIWDKLEELFLLIDKGSENMGIPEDDLYIPAYNGGLFKTEIDEDANDENIFLQNNKVGDSYLAEVIDLLTRHESDNGKGRVFVDYSSLDIRHLGSIYEGLLEYHLNVAPEPMVAVKDGKEQKWLAEEEFDDNKSKVIERVEKGDVYLTTDKGERKATGSYYTPEYVVQYIVENTLDPILQDIRDDLLRKGMGNFANEFAERVFELKILDPAMGSGHFLTNAVDHLAREIVKAHERQAEEQGAETIDESHDIHWARRQVVQRCIYGVDLNPMAVELAKVSLWLRTLASQQPLAFLDHHLKTGNSLIGSDIEVIEKLDKMSYSKNDETTLEDFGMTKKGTMEDLMKIYEQFIKIENQELSDIKEIEKKYQKFEHEPIKERLEAIANVHTAREFGLNIPKGSFKQMVKSINDESKWNEIEGKNWFDDAQKIAEDHDFFHWKLAYPEVFYGKDGGRKDNPGFDVVIGNPPYKIEYDERLKTYYENYYSSFIRNNDLYTAFIQRGISKVRNNGRFSYITPNTYLSGDYFDNLKGFIFNNLEIKKIVDFGTFKVFPEADVYCSIFVGKKKKINNQNPKLILNEHEEIIEKRAEKFEINVDDDWRPTHPIVKKMRRKSQKLENIAHVKDVGFNYWTKGRGKTRGEGSIGDRLLYDGDKQNPKDIPYLKGSDFDRYEKPETNKHWLRHDWEKRLNKNDIFRFSPDYLKVDEKIIYRQTSNKIQATIDNTGSFVDKTVHVVILKDIYKSKLSHKCLLPLLNSKLLNFTYKSIVKEEGRAYAQVKRYRIQELPISESLNNVCERFSDYADSIRDLKSQRNKINLSIMDYLGNYSDGRPLSDIYSPISGISSTILTNTTTENQNLRLGNIDFEKNENEVILNVSARYKPENPEEFEDLDRWGYTETELIPAMKFTGSEKELALIREFTKLAVDKGGGFANFRENATKTMSILDRLEKLTLPKLSDVENGLEKYLDQKEKAERLEKEIKETDHTIDAIVFDLYDLNEDEVETVLDSLDTPEEEKEDIIEKFKEVKNNK